MNCDIYQEQTTRYGLVFASNLVSDQAKSLSDASFRLWIILHTYSPSNPADGWTVGAERLAKDAGFSRSTFFRALAQLKDQELVRVENMKASGKPNRYILVNAVGVKTILGGVERGVNNDSPAFDSSHSCDTREGHPGDTHTGAVTGASNSNNPPNPPHVGGEKLNNLLNELLDGLLSQLGKKPIEEQCVFFYEGLLSIDNSILKDWDLKDHFKRMCMHTNGVDPICCAISEEVRTLAPPENGRQRSAIKRRAFLTKCHQAIRDYGQQL